MTLETVRIEITPVGAVFKNKPYIITLEHTAPHFLSAILLERIGKMLYEEFVKQGVENIKIVG